MDKIKILFIIPSLVRGGAEYNTIRLANYFASVGIEITILTIFNKLTLANELSSKVEVKVGDGNSFIGSISIIKKIINQSKPDVILSNQWPLNLCVFISSFFSAKKNVLILIEHINLSVGLKKSSLYEKLISKIFHFCSRIFNYKFIVVSEGVNQDLVDNFGVPKNKVKTIYNPAIENLPNDCCKLRKITDKDTLNILAVGNLKPQKDYLTMIESIAILKIEKNLNIILKIAGSGPENEKITKKIKELNLQNNIILLGQIDNVGKYYIECDIYLLTSAWEGFGNTIVEALSYGCRVVSTDCPSGPSEIINNQGLGILTTVGKPRLIAEAIMESMARMPNQNELRLRAEDFTQEKIAVLYLKELGL